MIRERANAAPVEPLLAPRINALSKALTRSAVDVARATFGLSQPEWQVITLLGVFAPISIRDLADHAMLDAGQVSRTVAALRERGCVLRERSAADSREAVLTLTAAGKAMYKRLRAAALKRNATLLEGYTDRQIATLFTMLDVILERARGGSDE